MGVRELQENAPAKNRNALNSTVNVLPTAEFAVLSVAAPTVAILILIIRMDRSSMPEI